jgi:hypothetical protein
MPPASDICKSLSRVISCCANGARDGGLSSPRVPPPDWTLPLSEGEVGGSESVMHITKLHSLRQWQIIQGGAEVESALVARRDTTRRDTTLLDWREED